MEDGNIFNVINEVYPITYQTIKAGIMVELSTKGNHETRYFQPSKEN
jgi:hypothetical protein